MKFLERYSDAIHTDDAKPSYFACIHRGRSDGKGCWFTTPCAFCPAEVQ